MTIDIPTSMFALWDVEEGWVVEPGLVKLFVGASSAAIRLRGEVTLTGKDHLPGPDRPLSSTVDVVANDLTYTASLSVPSPATTTNDPSLPPVSATSTVREWLDHPVGGVLLREALGGPDFDEDLLQPVFGLPLGNLVALSQGLFPQSKLDELLATVGPPSGAAVPHEEVAT